MTDEREAFLRGAYKMCALLLTSPRFNKPQREIIETASLPIQDELEALGVEFTGSAGERPEDVAALVDFAATPPDWKRP
jgi:hypothetical protein